jgi:hypothetical protein
MPPETEESPKFFQNDLRDTQTKERFGKSNANAMVCGVMERVAYSPCHITSHVFERKTSTFPTWILNSLLLNK